MKIIIAGCGKVGYALTRQLSSEGYDITIIDRDSDVLSNAMEHYDVMAVCGNCAIHRVLSSAGAQDADLLVATTGENPKPRIQRPDIRHARCFRAFYGYKSGKAGCA